MGSGEERPDQRPSGESGDTTPLRPVPPEGTAAPPRPDRVFGRAGAGSGRAGKGSAGRSDGFGSTGVPPPTSPAPLHLSEAERRKITLRGRLAIVLGVVALAASVPVFPLGIPLGVAAIILGVTSRRLAGRAGVAAPGAVPGVVVGSVAVLIASFMIVVVVLFFDELSEWQECLSAANTRSGEQICQQNLEDRLSERLGLALSG